MSRTVRVRIAVAVDETGAWQASGWSAGNDELRRDIAIDGLDTPYPIVLHWLEADVPLPTDGAVIEASIEEPAK